MALLPEPNGVDPLTNHRVVVKDSTAVLKEYPYQYAAGTEPLATEEMRITALGTGYPARRGQGCAGFMCELGNGEVFKRTNPGLAMSFHSMIAPGTPQPILDAIKTGYDGPVLVGQDFTVVNITPEQIVSRQVEYVPAPFLVSDPDYTAAMGGLHQDPSQDLGTLPKWLEDSIIPIPEIEEFKKELAKQGMH